MSVADPAAALAAYLLSTSVDALVDGNIFRPELDPDFVAGKTEPAPCIVIVPAGGYGLTGGRLVPSGDPRLDIFCYGESRQGAGVLAGEVIGAVRAFRSSVFEHTRIHWIRIEGGPMPVIDPETKWPVSVLSVQVAHCEVALA